MSQFFAQSAICHLRSILQPILQSVHYPFVKENDMKSLSGFSKQIQLMNKWTSIVKKYKEIDKYDLMIELRITVGQYNQMKGFVENRQSEIIEYDKPTQTWKFKGIPEE